MTDRALWVFGRVDFARVEIRMRLEEQVLKSAALRIKILWREMEIYDIRHASVIRYSSHGITQLLNVVVAVMPAALTALQEMLFIRFDKVRGDDQYNWKTSTNVSYNGHPLKMTNFPAKTFITLVFPSYFACLDFVGFILTSFAMCRHTV